MSMYTLLRNNPQPSVGHMEKAFEGTREFSLLAATCVVCCWHLQNSLDRMSVLIWIQNIWHSDCLAERFI